MKKHYKYICRVLFIFYFFVKNMSKCELLLPLQPVPSTTLPDLKHTNKKNMFCFERIMK